MFEFFLALFGGLFYTKKISSDKSQIKAERIKTDSKTKLNNKIRDTVVASHELQEETKRRLFSGMCVDDVYEELKEDFCFVFGEDINIAEKMWLPNDFDIDATKYLYDSPNRIYCWAYFLLLSHNGKVDEWLAYAHGFELGGKDSIERDIKFCQRIEHNLNNNGVDLKLYFEPQYSTYTKDYNDNPCGQKLVFEHQLYNPQRSKRLW